MAVAAPLALRRRRAAEGLRVRRHEGTTLKPRLAPFARQAWGALDEAQLCEPDLVVVLVGPIDALRRVYHAHLRRTGAKLLQSRPGTGGQSTFSPASLTSTGLRCARAAQEGKRIARRARTKLFEFAM